MHQILQQSKAYGLNYVIAQGPFCKTAYIEIPETHPFYKINYTKINTEYTRYIPHGFFTFSDSVPDFFGKGWWLGWDYGHEIGNIDDGFTIEGILDEILKVAQGLKDEEIEPSL